jgi:peptidyl-prolyl cis-trans isomerase SurA
LDIRKQAEKGDFGMLARKYSEDPSAKENGGDLGWFSALRMVYPFESAAYNTPKGKVSMPIRTRFGYHIIKSFGSRDALGEIAAAHIMIKTGKEATEEDRTKAKEKVMEVKALLEKGQNFEELAMKYSEDKGSSTKGGALPRFGTGRMVPAFEDAAFGLKNDGDISEPVLTDYGWHIIKRLERFPVSTFEEVEKELSAKVAKDSRSEMSKKSVLDRVKTEYGFKETKAAVTELSKYLNDKLIEGKWNADTTKGLTKTIFTIGQNKYTQADLGAYIGAHQARRKPEPLEIILNMLYNQYVDESLLAYEESRLPAKYPEYKALLKEYRDGILLFDLTDDKVWSKAVKDTAGLKAFHAKNASNFMWEKRLDAEIFYCQKDSIVEPLKALLTKRLKKGKPDKEEILKQFNANSKLNLRIEQGLYQENDEEILKNVKWEKGVYGPLKDGQNQVLVVVNKMLEPTPKTLKEARGLTTAEYQNFLEKEWIAQLRSKYKFTANRELLKQIK